MKRGGLCYDFSAENYAGYLSLLLSFLVFFIVMIAGVRRKIRYLITMRKELCMLSENLDCPVTLRGNDKIPMWLAA